MEKVLFSSRIKNTNLGDIFINALLIRELSKKYVVLIDGNNKELEGLVLLNNIYAKNIQIRNYIKFVEGFPVLRWLNIIFDIKNIKYVFDPPGHYSESTSKIKFSLKSIKYFVRAYLLKFLNVKVNRIGVTLGPFGDFGWKIQKIVCDQYKCVSVRDKANYEVLNNKKFDNVSLIDDLAFLYDPSEFNNKLILNDFNSPFFIISIRGAIEGKEIDKKYLNYLADWLSKMIEYQENSNYIFLLTYQVFEDLTAIKYLYNSLINYKTRIRLIEKQLSFVEACSLYSNADAIFTNRLHVSLLALLNTTPSLVVTDIEKHHKLVNIYKDLGLRSWLFDCTDDVNISDIYQIAKDKLILDNFIHTADHKRNNLRYILSSL